MFNKIYLIANWKMQLLNREAENLASQILQEYKKKEEQEKGLEIILCPSFTALAQVSTIIKGDSSVAPLPQNDIRLKLGAQDVFYHEKGAYTGEVSVLQLKEIGVEYVLIGHSERRQHLNETDEDVNRKVNICLDNGLTPILCVGETFDERRIGKTDLVLIRQVSRALEDVELPRPDGNRDSASKIELIIAYEPVWVIGSGQAVKPEEAEHVARVIKHTLLDFFDKETIEKNITIIYGGSVDADCISDFIMPGLLDGVLVGGASLTAEKFIPLITQLSSCPVGSSCRL